MRISDWSSDVCSSDLMVASHRLIAKMPTIAAMTYKYSVGQPFVYPRNNLGYAENFLHMMFSVPCEEYKISPVLARSEEHTSELQSLMRISYAVFCLKTTHKWMAALIRKHAYAKTISKPTMQ